jgi:hypothetical protein
MDPQHVDRDNPTAHWLDTLARTVASGHSRRAFLGRTGTGLVGTVLALLTPRWVGAAAPCPSNQKCGNTCCPSGSRCISGGGKPRCVCDATSCPNGCCQGGTCQAGTTAAACGSGGTACQACTGGTSCCAGTCVNLQTNPNNCGACGHICPPGQSCVSGACQCPATAPNFCASTNTCLAACPAGTSFDPSTCQCVACEACGSLGCQPANVCCLPGQDICGGMAPGVGPFICQCAQTTEGDHHCIKYAEAGSFCGACTSTADCEAQYPGLGFRCILEGGCGGPAGNCRPACCSNTCPPGQVTDANCQCVSCPSGTTACNGVACIPNCTGGTTLGQDCRCH